MTITKVKNDGVDFSEASNIAFDTNTLYVDAVNNRVGIGNIVPATALDVTGTITATGFASTGDMSFGDNDKAIFGAGSDLQIYHVSADNTSRIVEGGSGNLIIQGTNLRLGNADFSKAYFAADDGGAATIYYNDAPKLATTSTGVDVTGTVNITGDGDDLIVNSADYELVLLGNRGSSGVSLDQAYLRMKAEGVNTIVLDTAGNSYFNGGNVGIGTTSPPHTFAVQGSAAGQIGTFYDTGTNGGAMYNGAAVLSVSRRSNGSTSLNGEIFRVGRDNSDSATYNVSDSIFTVRSDSVVVNDSSTDYIDFRVEGNNYANLFTIDAGNDCVNIGANGGSSSNWLYVYEPNSSKTEAAVFNVATTSSFSGSAAMRINTHGYYSANFSHRGIQFRNADSNAGRNNVEQQFVNYAGTVVGSVVTTTTGTSFNGTSDYRLKENVVDLTGATERLTQIPVHQFNFIETPDIIQDGFLAHEVAAVVPNAVVGEKDALDNQGNPEYQTMDNSKLVPLLVATIKELEARITALENA